MRPVQLHRARNNDVRIAARQFVQESDRLTRWYERRDRRESGDPTGVPPQTIALASEMEQRVEEICAQLKERTYRARTTGGRPTVPNSTDAVGHGVVGLASTVAGFDGGSSSAYGRSGAEQSIGRSHAASPLGAVAVRVSSNAYVRAATRGCEQETFCSSWRWGYGSGRNALLDPPHRRA